jgi:hypothetical protein
VLPRHSQRAFCPPQLSPIPPPTSNATRGSLPAAARTQALEIWRPINLKNLEENILPTRQRARLILRKGADHRIETVALRRI